MNLLLGLKTFSLSSKYQRRFIYKYPSLGSIKAFRDPYEHK